MVSSDLTVSVLAVNEGALALVLDRVSRTPDGCWNWGGFFNDSGYGDVRAPGRRKAAHRVVYEMLIGPIPTGQHLDHLCRNRGCVNPEHLEPVTPAENNRRSAAVLRAMRAERKNTCLRGHALSGDNVTYTANGLRKCRACADIRAVARQNKLPEFLSRDEGVALLAQPNPRYPTGARNRALLATFYRAGLRCSEALNLTPRDVQWTKQKIRVNSGKGDKDRVVPVEATLLELLDRWREKRPKSDWFFCTLKGDRMEDSYVREMVARYGRKAGIEIRCHPHLLRHSYATDLLEDGAPVTHVQRLLGHAHLETTSIYLHATDRGLEETIAGRTWQAPKHARKR